MLLRLPASGMRDFKCEKRCVIVAKKRLKSIGDGVALVFEDNIHFDAATDGAVICGDEDDTAQLLYN